MNFIKLWLTARFYALTEAQFVLIVVHFTSSVNHLQQLTSECTREFLCSGKAYSALYLLATLNLTSKPSRSLVMSGGEREPLDEY